MNSPARFSVRVLGAQLWDLQRDNVDVEVVFDDGRRFSATFFTLTNLQLLFEKNKASGECESGLYLWASNMIIVRDLSLESIERTVKGLLSSSEFETAFAALPSRATDES